MEYGAVINFWCNIVRHFKEGAIGCGKHAVGAAPHPPHLKFGPGLDATTNQSIFCFVKARVEKSSKTFVELGF